MDSPSSGAAPVSAATSGEAAAGADGDGAELGADGAGELGAAGGAAAPPLAGAPAPGLSGMVFYLPVSGSQGALDFPPFYARAVRAI